jgi:serine/threonine-protein kinase PknG
MIQVGDSLKLIDLGGVRRQDDDQSAIYGTVGFQAPEVAREGCTVASDVYTIARTLAVMTFEFRGYQSQHEFSLPDPSTVPLLAQHDALYRWLVKGTATEPHDRFQTAEEMRQQLLGVLREVTAGATKGAVVRATPSALFTSPGLGVERLGWLDLPVCMVDVDDPMASWIAAVTTDEPGARDDALEGAPEKTAGVLAERAMAALRLGLPGQAHALCESMLQRDPWEWRAVYIQGLVAMACGDFGAAVGSFNAVYGQLPGELAPKLALAAACEANDEHDVAERLYRTCARTDAAYVAPAQFGLARLAAASGRREEALTALDQIPKTSAAFGESRRRRLELLIEGIDPSRRSADLATAAVELRSASLPTEQAIGMRINIFAALLRTIEVNGRIDGHIDGSPADESRVRTELETLYRQAARQATDHDERVRLVDEANRVRPRTRS